jgi:hypothetical protein
MLCFLFFCRLIEGKTTFTKLFLSDEKRKFSDIEQMALFDVQCFRYPADLIKILPILRKIVHGCWEALGG